MKRFALGMGLAYAGSVCLAVLLPALALVHCAGPAPVDVAGYDYYPAPMPDDLTGLKYCVSLHEDGSLRGEFVEATAACSGDERPSSPHTPSIGYRACR